MKSELNVDEVEVNFQELVAEFQRWHNIKYPDEAIELRVVTTSGLISFLVQKVRSLSAEGTESTLSDMIEQGFIAVA